MNNGQTLLEYPKEFFDWWKECMELFENAMPHKGYRVLKKIRDELYCSKSNRGRGLDIDNSKLNHQEKEMNSENNNNDDDNDNDQNDNEIEIEKRSFYIYTSNIDSLSQKAGKC
jgi:NAD-dependent SIR2 family protein deacetylase